MKRRAILGLMVVLALGGCGSDAGSSSGSERDYKSSSPSEPRHEAKLERQRERRLERQRQRRLEARLERRMALRIAKAETAREEEKQLAAPAPNCTDGYDPCLTPAFDYDCAGGSGDGPAYTGYVTVTGSDPYDLDADNDGSGCE